MSARSTAWEPDTSPFQAWRLVVHTTPVSFMVVWQVGVQAAGFFTVQAVTSPRVVPLERAWVGQDSWVQAARAVLGPGFTRGEEGDVVWDLAWEPQAEEVLPAGQGVMRHVPWGMRVVSWPRVRFVGRVRYDRETWEGVGWGAIARWWGRRLPSHWFWVNAPACDSRAGLEVWQARVPLGPMSWPQVTMGYFWYSDGHREVTWYQPLNATLDVAGPPDAVRVRVVPWHGTGYILTARTHPHVWQKVAGDHIVSLTGDARVLGGIACPNRVAIEWHRPPVL